MNKLNQVVTIFVVIFMIANISYGQASMSKDAAGPEFSPQGTPENHIVCEDGAYAQPLDMAAFATAANSDRSSDFAVADNFQVAVPTTVTSVCFWGINAEFNGGFMPCAMIPAEGSDAFEIVYREDNAGSPGAIIAGPFAAPGLKDATGIAFAFTEIYQYEVAHAPVALEPGVEYYVEITNSAGACIFLWVNNTAAPNDGTSWQSTDGGTTFANVNAYDLTFNLGGGPTPAEVVPTMGEWGIIVLSMLMLIFGTVAVTQRKAQVQIVKS